MTTKERIYWRIAMGICAFAILFLVVFGILVATGDIKTRSDKVHELEDRIEQLENQ